MRLRDLREDHDLSQNQLARMLFVSPGTYRYYETERHQLPIDLLLRLARFYTVSTDYILELTNIPDPYPSKAKKS